MMRTLRPALLALAVTMWAVPATAATVSGRVLDATASGVSGMTVRLWSEGDKGWAPVEEVTSGADGSYSFTDVAAGRYRVDVRLTPGLDRYEADRWWDTQAPVADGWAPHAADILTLESDTVSSDVDLPMPALSGLAGRVLIDDDPASQVWVRVDQNTDSARFRTMRANDNGEFAFRGVPPGDAHRIVVFDPSGEGATTVFDGPFSTSNGSETALSDLVVAPRAADPYEPNGGGNATTLPEGIFDGAAPDPYITEGAAIAPRGSDVDWYCWTASLGDRYLAYTLTDLDVAGEVIENPWIDPMLRFVSRAGEVIDESDDGDGFGLNAAVDSGGIPRAGTYCVVVTTFGDTAWDGTGQETAGDYTLVIEVGNRAPRVDLFVAESPAPTPPGQAIVSEGELLRIDIETFDAEGDDMTVTATFLDNTSTEVVPAGELVMQPDGRGSFTWLVPDDGARYAPYELTVSASDGEWTTERKLLIAPRTVNLPPGPPIPYLPENLGSVASYTPTLTIVNGEDPDGDVLTYEFEVHYGDPSVDPDEIGRVGEDPSGETSYTVVTPIAENQRISWRARSLDGALSGGVSPWSEFFEFVVNVDNADPSTPVLIKPDEGSTAGTRSPAATVNNANDEDGDSLSIVFEIGTDSAFTETVRTSDPVPQNTLAGRTSWSVEPPLEWGTDYAVRAYAVDPLGARSGYTETRNFRIKSNGEPLAPTPGGTFEAGCNELSYDLVGPSEFVINAVDDPDGEALTIDFRIYRWDDDVSVDEPVFQITIPQEARATTPHVIAMDPSLFEPETRYRVVVTADDGTDASDPLECDFWVLGDNQPPSDIAILAPENEAILPAGTTEALVVVQNATDPNAADTLSIAWCAANRGVEGTCPENRSTWPRVEQDPSGETNVEVTGLYNEAEVEFFACAHDGTTCGEVASVTFSVAGELPAVTPSLCTCSVRAAHPRDAFPIPMLVLGMLGLIRRRAVRRVA